MNQRFAVTSWSDQVAAPSPAPIPRAEGRLDLSFRRRGDETVLDHLYQQGCAKARFPRLETGALTTAVTLNTSGGLTGGDHLQTSVTWAEGTRATVASQAAERAYRSIGEVPARQETRLSVAPGAFAEWLPQETILFEASHLVRDLRIDLAGDGAFLGLEQVVFGRTARGESVRSGHFRDGWRLRRDGRLLFADVLSLDGDMQGRLDRLAAAQGCRAAATIVGAGGGLAQRVDDVRNALGNFALWGASAWQDMIVVRCLGATGADLRRMVLAALAPLRDGRPIPRVWQI